MGSINIKKGFTLIEMLVTIAIILILAALLFPVFTKAREKSQETVCISKMKQIYVGYNMYSSDNDGQPLGTFREDDVFPYIKNEYWKCPLDELDFTKYYGDEPPTSYKQIVQSEKELPPETILLLDIIHLQEKNVTITTRIDGKTTTRR